MDVLFSEKLLPEEKKKILEQEFDIPMSRVVEKELREMCNFSEGIWKRGICAGIRWGRNEEKQTGAFALISTLLRYGLDEEQIRAELVRNRYAENYLELYKASR